MTSSVGIQTRSTPRGSSRLRSRFRSRGYLERSSLGPNWVGLTKMDTITWSHSSLARRTSERCPSCRYPIVGTSPTLPGNESRAARRSVRVMALCIHATPDCLTRKSVLNLRYHLEPHASLENVFGSVRDKKGDMNGLRVYEFQRCDLLLARQEVHDFDRQGTDPVLLLEGSEGRHARCGAGRLQGGRDEDRLARPQEDWR